MSTTLDSSNSYDVQGFLLDPQRREIRYSGESLGCTDRTFELLWLLASNDSALVTKQELLDALWPDQYVTEASLSRLVSDTRQLLAERAPNQEIIQTVRGRGFRLRVPAQPVSPEPEPLAPVSTAAPNTGTASAALPSKTVAIAGRRTRWAAIAGCLFVFAAASALVLLPPMTTDTPPSTNPVSGADNEGTVLVLPVDVLTGDDQDSWAEYGLMAVLTQQLQAYTRVPVISAHSAVSGLAQIGYASTTDSAAGQALGGATFKRVCPALGCQQLVETTLTLEDTQLVLEYRIHSAASRSSVYRFAANDAMAAAEMLSEHLVAKLIPDSRERLDLRPFYSDDAMANRNLALGISSLYHADYAEAAVYLDLALKRQPDSFWARLFSADAAMRTGSIDTAQAHLAALDRRGLSDREQFELKRVESNLLYTAGDLQASQGVSLAMVDIARRMGDVEGQGIALMNTGTTFTALGESEPARRYIQQAEDIFLEHGYELRYAQAKFNRANALRIASADFDELAPLYRDAAALFLNSNANTFLAYALRALGDINLQRGRYADAEEELQRVKVLFQQANDTGGVIHVMTSLATLYLQTDDLVAAELQATDAYEAAGETYTYLRAFAAALLSQIFLETDQLTRIPPLLDEVDRAEWFDPRAQYALLRACFAHKSGELREAVDLARAVKARLGDDWTELHETYLTVFEQSLAAERIIPLVYYNGSRKS
ncbi:MAG: winged helix-turn-helix domain-containing protein [Pseudomonadota bacterium]